MKKAAKQIALRLDKSMELRCGADLTGEKFGNWLVLKFAGRNERSHNYWLCQCGCGSAPRIFAVGRLTGGRSRSCGCLKHKWPRGPHPNKTHGMRNTKTYHVWQSMRTRCYNSRCHQWPHYGGRGIQVCERWKTSFENFLVDMGEAPSGMSLDRINNNDNYSPENCKWSTWHQQSRNKSTNRLLTHNGITMCLRDWSKKYNLPYCTLHKRFMRGLSPEKCLGITSTKP